MLPFILEVFCMKKTGKPTKLKVDLYEKNRVTQETCFFHAFCIFGKEQYFLMSPFILEVFCMKNRAAQET